MKKLVLAFIVVVGLCVGMQACAPTATPTPADIVGIYEVNGANSDGSKYTLNIRLQKSPTDDLYVLEYIEEGQMAAVGFGIRTGDVLSVIFQTVQGVVGLASFKIEGGILTGTWMMPGTEGIGTEVLTPTEGLAAPRTVEPVSPPTPVGAQQERIEI